MNQNFVTRNHCPACHFEQFTPLLSVPFSDKRIWSFLLAHYHAQIPLEKVTLADYVAVECHRCGLIFQQHILNDENMGYLYEKWILPQKSLDKKRLAGGRLFQGYAFELGQISRRFKKPPHEIALLDYGMGWGYWARMAAAFNFHVTGVEISSSRIEYAKQLGVTAVSSLSKLENKQFDYIYANQVFEHLPLPAQTLKELSLFLQEDGVIHIQVPDGRLAKRALQAPNWTAQKGPVQPLEHINCFTRESWRVMADRAGLTVESPRLLPRFSGIKPFVGSIMKYFGSFSAPHELFLIKSGPNGGKRP